MEEKSQTEENFFITMIKNQAFGRALRKYRKGNNLTRRDVIQSLNIEGHGGGLERNLNRWESGEVFPTPEKISNMLKESPKFADVFNAEVKKISEEFVYFYREIFESDEKTVDFFETQAVLEYLPQVTDALYYDNKKMLMEFKDFYGVQLAVNNFLKKKE